MGAAAVVTAIAIAASVHALSGPEGGRRTSSDAAAGRTSAGRSARPAPSPSPSRPPSERELLSRTYDVPAKLALGGRYSAAPGHQEPPRTGRHRYTYRVDVERGLKLDGDLFARFVQRTLNDPRSWAHGGARSFERVSGRHPDFVVTLASPGSVAKQCAKVGLDTAEENVSCDAAGTPRVMINAYRWARGAPTYGPDHMLGYRQMLVNHEVGHRMGHNHEYCRKDGAAAPVMMQQTKTLTTGGRTCTRNAWPHPGH